MIRSRVCLLSVVAALLVAGPAMAYSWPLLFGLPALFGQDGLNAEKPLPPPPSPFEKPLPPAPSFEESESEFRDLLAIVKETHCGSLWAPPSEYKPLPMPYAEECRRCPVSSDDCCDPAGKFIGIWQRLWRQGKFREAFVAARCAVQADPVNVDARHAFVLSQIVNETSTSNGFRWFAQQHCPELEFNAQYPPPSAGSKRLNGDQPWNGLLPAGTLTSDLRIPLKAASCDIDSCCPMIDCPLVVLFETVFGGCRETKTAACGPCPVAHGCRSQPDDRCTQAEAAVADGGMQIVRGPQGTKMIWIIREPEVTVTHGPAVPIPFPPAPVVSRPTPLPPAHLAPPPPPIMASPDGMVIPVPVAAPQPHPQYAPPQYAQPALYDPAAERCEAVPPPLPLSALPKHVQITQSGRHVQLSSPNYSAQCDRIRGGANGELILEGNVRLISRRHGQTMTINAQRVLLNVQHDQFVVEQADGMEQSRVNIAPVGCSPSDERMQEMLNENDYRGQIGTQPRDSRRLSPIRVHGGVGP